MSALDRPEYKRSQLNNLLNIRTVVRGSLRLVAMVGSASVRRTGIAWELIF